MGFPEAKIVVIRNVDNFRVDKAGLSDSKMTVCCDTFYFFRHNNVLVDYLFLFVSDFVCLKGNGTLNGYQREKLKKVVWHH
jgi:hypothetical protein